MGNRHHTVNALLRQYQGAMVLWNRHRSGFRPFARRSGTDEISE